jgi:hypothetical protein
MIILPPYTLGIDEAVSINEDRKRKGLQLKG